MTFTRLCGRLIFTFLCLFNCGLAAIGQIDDAEVPKQKRFALLVGVGLYTNYGKLTGPERDVQQLRDALSVYGGFPPDNIVVLTTEPGNPYKPDRDTIIQQLGRLRESAKDGGLAFFMFSGHGNTGSDGKAYLLPTGASGNGTLVAATSISEELVSGQLASSGAKQVVILLDACRDRVQDGTKDIAGNKLTPAYTAPFDFAAKNNNVESLVVFYATKKNTVAYVDKHEDMGFFTRAVVEALRGAETTGSDVTIRNIIHWVQEQVPRRVTKQYPDGDQVPWASTSGINAESLIVSHIPTNQQVIVDLPPEGGAPARGPVVDTPTRQETVETIGPIHQYANSGETLDKPNTLRLDRVALLNRAYTQKTIACGSDESAGCDQLLLDMPPGIEMVVEGQAGQNGVWKFSDVRLSGDLLTWRTFCVPPHSAIFKHYSCSMDVTVKVHRER